MQPEEVIIQAKDGKTGVKAARDLRGVYLEKPAARRLLPTRTLTRSAIAWAGAGHHWRPGIVVSRSRP
jgi:hypothetical protein